MVLIISIFHFSHQNFTGHRETLSPLNVSPKHPLRWTLVSQTPDRIET